MSTELIRWERYRLVCVRDPGKKRIELGAQGFLDLWISIGSGPGTQGPGLEGKLLHLYAFINRYIYIYIYTYNIYVYINLHLSDLFWTCWRTWDGYVSGARVTSEQNSGPEAVFGLQWARGPELQIKAHKTCRSDVCRVVAESSYICIFRYIYIYICLQSWSVENDIGGMCPGPGQEENRVRGPRLSGHGFPSAWGLEWRSRFRKEIVREITICR